MKTTAKVIFLFLFGIFTNSVSAQNKAECEKIVSATVEAVNKKTPEKLEQFLAPDFSFSGQKAPIAKFVLNQLLKQLNDEVVDFKKTGEQAKDSELTLIYEFTYKNLGKKTTTFVFNNDGKLRQLELFAIQVKTMTKDEMQVQKSNEKSITVPVEIKNKIPIVKALINGESRNFIFDSGSARLVMNGKRINANSNKTINNVQGVNTSDSNLDITQIGDFNFNGIQVKDSKVLTTDLTHLEKQLNTELYGIIGYEILKDYDILYDYPHNQITLLQPDFTNDYLKTNYPNSKKEEIPVEMYKHLPLVTGIIGDSKFRLGFDSGSSGSLLDKNSSTRRKNMSLNLKTGISQVWEKADR